MHWRTDGQGRLEDRPERTSSRIRVLVVDDHEDSRTIARLVLENAGCEVAEAATGPDGLRVALADPPDVILVDIVLPQMDGWELARRLRANASTRRAHIVAVTALADADTYERTMAAGCDGVLTKPVHIANLVAAIRSSVAKKPPLV